MCFDLIPHPSLHSSQNQTHLPSFLCLTSLLSLEETTSQPNIALHVAVFYLHVHVCTRYVSCAHISQKAVDPLDVELLMTVNCSLGSGNHVLTTDAWLQLLLILFTIALQY